MDPDIAAAPIATDGGWGWIALSGVFMIGTFLAGYLKSVGVLMVQWQIEYGVGAQEVSWIGIALGFVTCTGAVIASALSSRFGSRIIVIIGCFVVAITLLLGSFTCQLWQLYVTNLLTGLGIALGYLPSLVSVGFYFDKKVGLANGIGFSGSGFGLIVVPPILQLLVEYFGWRTALRILAGSSLLPCLCGFLIKPTEKEIFWMTKEKKQRKKSLLQENGREVVEPVLPSDDTTKPNSAIKDSQVMSKRIKKVLYSCLKCGGFHLLIENKIFIFIILTFVWTSFGSFGSTIYFNARAVFDVGLTQLEASYLISAIGLGNLLGRVGHGIFLDRNFMTPLGMYSLTSVISAISIICYPFLDNFWTLLSCALIFGLTNGPYPSLQVMVLRDMLSPGDVSGGFGVVLFFNGFAMVTGVLIMSFLFDTSGSYDLSFFVAGISLFISGFLLFLLLIQKKLKRASGIEAIPDEDDEINQQEATTTEFITANESQEVTKQNVTCDVTKSRESSV
ncbi:putative monocarboxylate transporter 13 [Apostichopus japonicus]|uniref:Putative monocarboxylate transporter 13 n=1 Tax=Stichopus japonicus TaxID=307972 RepID=A0A2G8L3D6_STIJA|nr:putative monocarboxylate transporter 13 [Apostichopus japonicus]